MSKFGKEIDKNKIISLSDLEKTNKAKELQKAVVAFDFGGGSTVLMYQGECIHLETEALGYDADELGLIDKTSPDNGIWIWEGYFRYNQDWEGEWDCSVSTERWREPTNEELKLIAKGECPFDKDQAED